MPDMEDFEKELAEAQGAEAQDDFQDQITEEETVTEEAPEVAEPVEEPIEEPQVEAVQREEPEEQSEEVQPEVKRYKIPDHEKFGEFAGKRLTAQEMEEANLLERFNTLENNDAHHQKLYGDLKEKWDAKLEEENQALKEAAMPRQPDVPIGEQIKSNLSQMRNGYMPGLKQNAEAGAFEEDFLIMFPDLAVQLEHRFVAGNGAIEALAKEVAQQATFINALLGVVEEASNSERFTGSISTMVEENPDRYGMLREGTNQNEFVSWMNSDENPMHFNQMKPETITPAVLAQAFLGFIDANQSLIAAPVAATPAVAPVSTGGGTGTGVMRSKPAVTEMDAFERAFEEASLS